MLFTPLHPTGMIILIGRFPESVKKVVAQYVAFRLFGRFSISIGIVKPDANVLCENL